MNFTVRIRNFHRNFPVDHVADFVTNILLSRRLNSTRVTQMDLSRTCHELCRNHLDMSRWLEIPKLPCDINVSWFV